MTARYFLTRPKDDEAHIILIVTRGRGRRIRVHSGYKVAPDNWLQDEQRIRKSVKGAGGKNAALDRLRHDAEAMALNHPDDDDLKRAIQARVGRGAVKASKTIHEHYAAFLENKTLHVKEATVKVFRTLQSHMKAHLPARMMPGDIRPTTISEFQTALISGGMNNNSANKYSARLRSFFLWLEENEVIGTAPKMKSLKVAHNDVVRLDLQELAALRTLNLSDAPPAQSAARDIFLFSAYTGLRFGDCMNLDWNRIGDDALFLSEGKTGRYRRIPMTNAARQIVEKYEGRKRPLPQISNQKANDALKVVAKRAGIVAPVVLSDRKGGTTTVETTPKHEALSMHAGRRTFISLMLESGVSTKEMLGVTHTDLRSLQRYAAASEDHLRRNMQSTFDAAEAK
jgi:site-specific recombinase XerD